MKTGKKLFIIIAVAIFIYWPGISAVYLACHAIEIDENVCFTIGSFRISVPAYGEWEEDSDSLIIEDKTSARESLQTGETLGHASSTLGW